MTHHTGYRRFKTSIQNIIGERQRIEPLDHAQFLRNLGQIIRQTRRQKKLTQEDLGELAGVNAKYLGEVELGKANPTVVFLAKVSSVLALEMSDLFLGCQSPREEDVLILGEIMAILRGLDQQNLQKIHKVIKLIVEW